MRRATMRICSSHEPHNNPAFTMLRDDNLLRLIEGTLSSPRFVSFRSSKSQVGAFRGKHDQLNNSRVHTILLHGALDTIQRLSYRKHG